MKTKFCPRTAPRRGWSIYRSDWEHDYWCPTFLVPLFRAGLAAKAWFTHGFSLWLQPEGGYKTSKRQSWPLLHWFVRCEVAQRPWRGLCWEQQEPDPHFPPYDRLARCTAPYGLHILYAILRKLIRD